MAEINDRMINTMIRQLKREKYNPPYCLICKKEIDISKYPEITEIQIEPDMKKDEIILYPCNAEITRSNTGIYEITYIPEK